ncbi:protein FANTASTIC FOUR 3-like isoform X2 [Phragmites australis]|uniref:protein FANTASTIC FOUR 3-like isoform X2 n=1 Tax=Phragmites australis TaxID=29695 RepID=UPI002D78DB84|nr:protein FANTASTIC FOUR 3-like isoform X2 [Phragmites australis]
MNAFCIAVTVIFSSCTPASSCEMKRNIPIPQPQKPASFSTSPFLPVHISLCLTSQSNTKIRVKLTVTHLKLFCKSFGPDTISGLTELTPLQLQMATDGGLRRVFEKPLPENPTLLEALSAWNQHIHPKKPVDPASITEIFGELHFQEKQPDRAVLPQPAPAPAPRPPPRTASWLDIADADKSKDDLSLDALLRPKQASGAGAVKRSASFCMKKNSASLLLCTEGLGSESAVDADDLLKDGDTETDVLCPGKGMDHVDRSGDEEVAVEAGKEEEKRLPSFPPPIRSIGRGGKPCMCFRSFRADGRFVLTEVVIPGKELLQSSREGGRLRLQFANAAATAANAGVNEEKHGEDDDDEGKSACIDEDES